MIKERLEMTIPVLSYEFVVSFIMGIVVVIATVVAVVNLLFLRVAFAASSLWLTFMAWRTWAACKRQGSLYGCLIDFFGLLAPRQFVEAIPLDTDSVEIRIGYRLFWARLFYLRMLLDRISGVDWSPGQIPRSWCLFIRFNQPEKDQPGRCARPEDNGIYCVGPSRGKKKIEALGLAFVDFLRRAGAQLTQGKDGCAFVVDRSQNDAIANQ